MVYPRSFGDRLAWQDRFTNVGTVISNGGVIVGSPTILKGLSGGQVRYYGVAHDVRWYGGFRLIGRVTFAASGSDQALLSLGTAGARRLEFGINGTGQPYVWGTSQVIMGLAVTNGAHDVEFAIGPVGDAVSVTIDGVLWGSTTVSLSGAVDRLVAGGSCLGTLPWQGAIYDLRVARNQTDVETIGSLLGSSALYWDFTQGVVRNTPPNNTNSNFAAWTGTFPNETPTGWTKTPAVGTANDYVANATNACKLYSTTALTQLDKAAITGNRYRIDLSVSQVVSGGLIDNYNATTQITAPGVYSKELTATGGTIGMKRWVYPTDITFTDLTFTNLSVTTAAPLIARGTLSSASLAQGVASAMGWQVTGGLKFDGTADYMVSGALTIPQPSHIFIAFNMSDVANSTMLDGAANELRIYAPGSGTLRTYAGAFGPSIAYTAGVTQVVDAVFNGASSKIGINGGTQVVGNAGANNATKLTLASFGTPGSYLSGSVYKLVVNLGELTGDARTQLVALLQSGLP